MPELVYDKRGLENIRAFEDNIHWFKDNYSELKSKYRGQYVAIQNKAVVGSDKNSSVLLENLKRKSIDLTTLAIEFIDESHTVYVL